MIDPGEDERPQRPFLVVLVDEYFIDLVEIEDEFARVTSDEEEDDDEEERGHGVVPPLVVGDGVVPLVDLPDGLVGDRVAKDEGDQGRRHHHHEIDQDDDVGVGGVVAEVGHGHPHPGLVQAGLLGLPFVIFEGNLATKKAQMGKLPRGENGCNPLLGFKERHVNGVIA